MARHHHLADAGKRVEWELLPSLRHALKQPRRGAQPAWQDTVPSAFETADAFAGSMAVSVMPAMPATPAAAAEPVETEALPGLLVREVSEPEIFRIFFGGR